MLTIGTDAYLTVDEADDYWLKRGDPDAWSQNTVEEKETAIRYATIFVDRHYEWIGTPRRINQRLAWPRIFAWNEYRRIYLDAYDVANVSGLEVENVLDSNGIPFAVKDAVCEMALSHFRDGALNKVIYNANPAITRVQAGSVAVDFNPNVNTSPASYDWIDLIVRGLHLGGSNSVAVMRG